MQGQPYQASKRAVEQTNNRTDRVGYLGSKIRREEESHSIYDYGVRGPASKYGVTRIDERRGSRLISTRWYDLTMFTAAHIV